MGEPTHDTVRITLDSMSLNELVSIARGAGVRLSSEAVDRIAASREVVDRALEGDELVYGLNTGLGHARNQRLPDEILRSLQPVTVAMHDGSMGDPLPIEVVRAAMAVRLNGIARGGSGATVATAKTLEAMLNAGVHPIVPATASVGAADLGHMAAIAMVAIGEGRALYDGIEMAGDKALRAAGIAPLELEPKDGLAMVSANGVTVGHSALVLGRLGAAMDTADLVAAVSLESFGGNPSIVEPSVARAKASHGQIETSRRIRSALENSNRFGPDSSMSVQDPLTFRVVPQVHGALRDLHAIASDAVEAELNGLGDNPLVSIEEGRLISNGNFHPMLTALCVDALRPAIAHVGQLSERRLGHLWDGFVADIQNADIGELPMGAPGAAGLLLRYAAAARFTRLRQLADPVTLDVPSLDLGVEDHATNAPEAARRTDESLDVLDDLLTVELLVAHTVLQRIDPPPRLGDGTGTLVAALTHLLQGIPSGTPTARVQVETRRFLVGWRDPEN